MEAVSLIVNLFTIFLLVAFLIEAVWEALKPVFGGLVDRAQNRGIPVDRLACLVLSLIICLGIGSAVDLFALLGLTLGTKYLGTILTAFILARGSNFVHDKLTALSGIAQNNKLDAQYLNNKIDAGM